MYVCPREHTPAEIHRARLEAERLRRELEDELGVQAVAVRTEAKREEELVERQRWRSQEKKGLSLVSFCFP